MAPLPHVVQKAFKSSSCLEDSKAVIVICANCCRKAPQVSWGLVGCSWAVLHQALCLDFNATPCMANHTASSGHSTLSIWMAPRAASMYEASCSTGRLSHVWKICTTCLQKCLASGQCHIPWSTHLSVAPQDGHVVALHNRMGFVPSHVYLRINSRIWLGRTSPSKGRASCRCQFCQRRRP